jgi:predicted TIM-barrel fold metal-dependent hydrolase
LERSMHGKHARRPSPQLHGASTAGTLTAMVIDAHAHADENEIWGWYDPPEKLIALMDEAGIDLSVVTSYSDEPGPSPGLRNLMRYVSRYPERLIGFPRIDPKFGRSSVELLERVIRENPLMKGLKLHPISNLVKPFAERCLELMRKAGELGVPVFSHCGDAVPALPLQIGKAAVMCPETTIICHLGGYFHAEEIIRVAENRPNLVLDTSSCPFPAAIRRAIEVLGPDRVVFASDNPAGDPISELGKIRMLGLPKPVEEKILWRNIARILALKLPRNGR